MNGQWVLPRQHLASELSAISDWSVSVVCVPFGFGKRTALEAWALERQQEGVAVSWVDAAISANVLESVELAKPSSGRFAIIVTGFEAVEDVSVSRELVHLGLKVPRGSNIVLVSNAVPRFGEIGLIPFMNCAVVDKSAFLFDSSEIESLYDERLVPDEERRTSFLVEQCGGWPFFVFSEFSPASARMSDRQRKAQEDAYLEGLLRSIGKPAREFVERICFLDDIRADLCELLFEGHVPHVDGSAMIELLERCGFLENTRRDWWRLFLPIREHVARLGLAHKGQGARSLSRKAYAWYRSQGLREEAARQMAMMMDLEDTLSVMRGLLPGDIILDSGLAERLVSKPLSWLSASPNACLAVAMAYLFAGDGASSSYWVQKLKRACDSMDQGPMRDAFLKCVPFLELKAYTHLGECRHAIQIGEEILSSAEPLKATTEAYARQALGESYEQEGRLEEARLQYEAALVLAIGESSPMLLAYVFYDLVWLLFRMARIGEADAKCREALTLCPHDVPTYAGLRYFEEFLDVERGVSVDVDTVDEEFAQLVSAENNPDLFLDMNVVHARAAHACGNTQMALSIITGALAKVGDLSVPRAAIVPALAERVVLALARQSASEAQAVCSRMAQLASVGGTIQHLYLLISEARIALYNGDVDGVRAFSKRVLKTARENGALIFELYAHILLACSSALEANRVHVERSLADALRCCRGTGFVYPFLSHRRLLRPHLFDLVTSKKLNYADLKHAKRILVAFDRMGAGAPDAGDVDVRGILTRKEHEVLLLLSLGYSREEMASTLVVSINTVKTHLVQIYAKLGVHSRSEALKEARSLGLLAD